MNDFRLTHLCFADDVLVFSYGKKRSIEDIMSVFKEFAAVYKSGEVKIVYGRSGR